MNGFELPTKAVFEGPSALCGVFWASFVGIGGKPQDPHRDYHMGFQQDDIINYFPTHMQIASQFLTLQGLIAHMPRASGPTRLLPFSQLYGPGYMAYRLPEFREYFNQTYIDLPLAKGDMVFFNPALFHAGGENLMRGLATWCKSRLR